MKQIEVNTIACASGCISQRIPQLHKYVISLRDGVKEDNYEHEMPTQFTGEGLAEGLATAWKQYGSDSAVIVMLINSAEKNVFDMYHLDACLWLNHGIKLVHFMFDDVIEGAQHEAKLHKNGALFVGGYEAAVIYFRTAYSPAHYLSQKHWDARLMFERSRSIQCPSVAMQLAGSKRVQEELGRPGVLEKFLSSRDDVEQVKATFLKMYSLDQTEEGNSAAAKAITDPSSYILKPQREGGGMVKFSKIYSKLL
jgi:glutathione synthase